VITAQSTGLTIKSNRSGTGYGSTVSRLKWVKSRNWRGLR